MMALKCKCKKDYWYEYKTSNTSPWFKATIFNTNVEYVFYNKGKDFYVSTDEKYLRHIQRYNAMIEGMDKNKFDEHFEYEKKMKTKTEDVVMNPINKKWLDVRNDIVSRINNGLFDSISEIDKERYYQAEKMLGIESIIVEPKKK